MSTLVYMKLLEQTPAKYDRGMQVLSLGRIGKVKQEIASAWVEPGHRVLEIGCGAGSLAALMTGRGAHVIGIDTSEAMLAVARKAAPAADLHLLAAIEIDRFDEGSFDRIVTTLVLSELSDDEIQCVLRSSLRLLKPKGKLIVADEVRPAAWWQRLISCLVRWPLATLTFLLTQNTTHALRGLEERLGKAGYRIVSRRQYLAGTLALIVAEKA